MNNKDFLLHNSYTFWISRLASLMQDEFNSSLQEEGVSWPQWMVMNVLHHQLAGTPATIADSIGVDRSAITRLLDRLEKKALVQREHDKIDRRSVKVELTHAGRELMGRINALAAEHQSHFLESLHSTEHRAFKSCIQRMLRRGGVDSLRVWN